MALSAADVSDLAVASGHRSGLSGINYVYVQQRRNGIPVAGDPVAGNLCQRGAATDDLARRYPHPDWDFSPVRDPRAWATDGSGWFSPLRADDRIPLFRQFLGGLPADKDILVVGHSGFWKKLFGQDQIMANCEVLTRGLDG